nr:hypothetical protein GCM10020185_31880 [Pseudomonas brassicacearum subsp. brassicacearum]
MLELTDGKKVPVVYDGVGKDTWLTSLDSVAPRGLVVSFGNASGAVDGVNLGILAAKGSLYVTRPTLATYANNAEKPAAHGRRAVRDDQQRQDQSGYQPALSIGGSGQGSYRVIGAAHDGVDRSPALNYRVFVMASSRASHAPTGYVLWK